MGAVLRQRIRGAVSVLLVVILCGAVDGLGKAAGEQESMFLSMAGALSITLLTAGSLDTLLGLGRETIEQLSLFSRALLPTLAAATAAAGSIGTATVQQVTAVFLVDLLVTMIHQLLLPLVYLYIGVSSTASAALPDGRLGALAEGLKKTITWMLTTSLLLFTIYLSVSRVFTGAADAAAIKVTKAAILRRGASGRGHHLRRGRNGTGWSRAFEKHHRRIRDPCHPGRLCLPLFYSGDTVSAVQAHCLSGRGPGRARLCRLVDGLGGAFGLVLGMTGSCALLILILRYCPSWRRWCHDRGVAAMAHLRCDGVQSPLRGPDAAARGDAAAVGRFTGGRILLVALARPLLGAGLTTGDGYGTLPPEG